jgi:hypothetical protein
MNNEPNEPETEEERKLREMIHDVLYPDPYFPDPYQ